MAGPSSAGPDGYAEWHHDPADDDWPDDEGGGLLSRRFGRGGDAAPADSGKGGGRSRNRGRKRRRFRGKAAFTIAILAVVLVLGAGTFVGYKYINRVINDRYGDYHGPGYGTVQVTVPEGANLVGLGPMLVRQGVIKAVRPFDSAAAAAKGTLQPGLYKLHHHMNAAMAVTLLLGSAARIPDQVTIIEGTRASEIAKQFADRTGFSSSSFMQIIDHPPASLGLPSWAGPTAEGFLFPDTYTLTPHETQLQILQAMVREFNQHVASINIASEAAKVFTTPWHVLIVASMVQAEGGRLQDFGGIARVAWNRLRVKMPLQFDSTVFYAMGSHGTAITQQDEKYDSPYNTYLHKGLPPGPIGNPGIDAIKAALHPASGGWLYFITDTRPKHPPYPTYFTKSLKQLQIWQRKFQN